MTKVDYLIFCERFQEELQRKLVFEPISIPKFEHYLPEIAKLILETIGVFNENISFEFLNDDLQHLKIKMKALVDGKEEVVIIKFN
jgi:hypothetical protein